MPATLLSRHVTAFLNCAREGSFTKAASMMFISPTALIAQIDLFEARLGFKLFERTHRGLRLTPSGESLYADALHLESAARGAVRRAFDLSLEENSLSVGTSPVVPGTLAVTLWQQVRSKLPSLNLRLVPSDNSPERAAYILSHLGEEIDLVPGLYDPPFLKRYGCAALFCEEARLVLAIPEGHPLYGRGELTPDELKGSALRMPSPGFCELYDRTAAYLRENYPELQVTDMPFRAYKGLDGYDAPHLGPNLPDPGKYTLPLSGERPTHWQG